ncbi:MAG TPA: cyclic nucleotide-binding domain-containing protein [Anaerolineae bacterium]|nr:cyclic nucleotide-binding domain-containing protein [Anaerolineae bacterium]
MADDRINILKTVSLFIETPEELLAEVAALLEEIEVKAGDTIFEKGDPGSSMYIIVEGRARAHDGDRTLNFLFKRDVFGEMAALDPEPRSASVTAVEDTRLFRLSQEAFQELMRKRPVVMYGIIRILTRRLRDRMRDMAEDFKYMQQFARVTAAAAAVEAGIYEPEGLDEVAERTDQLGQLARVFLRMVREVYAREQHLKQQVAELRIEIDKAKQARHVAEITETDYFQDLQRKARELRASRGDRTE